MTLRLGALLTHPIQYYSPWLRHLAGQADLKVYYAHQQTAQGQAKAGFGQAFEWDVPLLDGYDWQWLDNISKRPGIDHFAGCDTPEIDGIIARERFDGFMMMGWNRKSFLQAGWACYRTGTPLLMRTDSNLTSPRSALTLAVKRAAYSAILPRVGHYLSPGSRTDAYLRHYAVSEDRIHRLPHMIDVERFAAGAAKARANGDAAAFRARHGAGEGDRVFLFVAKMIAKKRPMLLLEALERARAAGPQIKVWFAGDGPLRAELETKAKALDLPVAFLGFVNQSQLPTVYAAADCQVLPSDTEETWGLVVNEGFACGLPAIVSTEAGCAPELIQDGVTGWTMLQPDPDHLAQLMLTASAKVRDLPRGPIDSHSQQGSYAFGTHRLLAIVERLKAARR
ncbi:glycosyltransferase [Caulobacter sp. SLTY]|uniref:glycosyltransferase family 4 protein n=1 Tax=Caulobacter sp. SLTY TaxID=2683262 RepID=UPI0014129C7F|nr:glycosyltransferase family 4 protein [Caulobacter sp. SLTY]NBB16038.1 glycosyltransferase [Caulobacter sp. SLTY]